MAARRGSIVLVLLAALAILAGTAATLLSGGRWSGGPGSSTADGAGPAGSRGFGPGFSQGSGPSRPATVGALVLRFPERTPVAGAQVVLHTGPGRIERTTDADGRAFFADALSGRARVDTFAEGFEPDQRTADVSPGENRTVEILLVESASIEGRVVAAADGTPIAGARVQPRGEEQFTSFVNLEGVGFRQVHDTRATRPGATTGADGSFRLRAGRPGGCVLLDVTAEGFAAEVAPVWMPEDRAVPATAEIRLARTGRIRGTVRDARGLPIDGAAVRANSYGSSPGTSATSGPDGAYVVEGLAVDAVYQVRTLGWTAGRQKPGRPPMSPAVEVHLPADPGEATVDLVVPGVGKLLVEWADASGRSDGPARCVAYPFDGSPGAVSATSDPPGTAGLAMELAEGRYRVAVDSTLYGAGAAEAVVVADAEARIRVTVGTGPALEGIVVDEAGRPVPGVLVRALTPRDATDAETRDPDPRAPAAPTRVQEAIRVQEGPSGGMRVIAAVLKADDGVARAAALAYSLAVHHSRTDAAGRFRIEKLAPGFPWLLFVRESGLHVEPAGPFPVPTADIRLVALRSGALQGRLFLPAGAAVPARRSIHFESASAAGHVESTLRTTGPFGDGSFRIEDLPPGKGRLWADSETAYLEPVEVVIPSREAVDAGTLPMVPAFTLSGRVVRPMGEPAIGARIHVSAAEPVTTGADGLFSVGGLRKGEVVVRIYASAFDGLWSATLRVTLPREDGAAEPLEIRVGTLGMVSGTARDAAGRPLASWRVRARPASEPVSRHDLVGIVTHRGMYELRLPAGEWVVTLHKPGVQEATAEAAVTMPDNGRANVEFRLSPK